MKTFRPVFLVVFSTLLFFAIHKSLFSFFGIEAADFSIPLENLYFFFALCSVAIIGIVLVISRKSFDNVGMSFLVITSIKMILCYILVRPILNEAQTNSIEKMNFFGMFILFLAMETITTIRILNNKQ